MFFVGDAAGRQKDFSCDDRKFAANVGIKFYTEKQFFQNLPNEHFEWKSFNPFTFKSMDSLDFSSVANDHNEMIIFVGMPGSGKSTFTKKYLDGYERVNRDTLGSKSLCEKKTREFLDKSKSVIIDNTNPSREARRTFIEIAKEYNVPVRCLVFKTPEDLAKHLNAVREKKWV